MFLIEIKRRGGGGGVLQIISNSSSSFFKLFQIGSFVLWSKNLSPPAICYCYQHHQFQFEIIWKEPLLLIFISTRNFFVTPCINKAQSVSRFGSVKAPLTRARNEGKPMNNKTHCFLFLSHCLVDLFEVFLNGTFEMKLPIPNHPRPS